MHCDLKLGELLLQIITAKPPMGLTQQVENANESKRCDKILEPTVKDWPMEEALSFAELALKCSELRRRDRPALDSVILPELERLRNQMRSTTKYRKKKLCGQLFLNIARIQRR